MTPVFAGVAGNVQAIAVPEDYVIIPPGATHYVVEKLASEFGRRLVRVTYLKQPRTECSESTQFWTGAAWHTGMNSPRATIRSIAEHAEFGQAGRDRSS